jgi:Uma2 family endonuclease
MTAIALPIEPSPLSIEAKNKKIITWEAFKSRFLVREDGYTYELVNGEVIKTKRSMDYSQEFIVDNLLSFFETLKAEKGIDGRLTKEVDTLFAGNHRRPDICYLTNAQIRATKNGIAPVPQFVIEIISNNDKMKRSKEKLQDYWRAGVTVIWHIYPDLEVVDVYKGRNMVACMDDDLCSAEPVLPDFVLSVKDIFR